MGEYTRKYQSNINAESFSYKWTCVFRTSIFIILAAIHAGFLPCKCSDCDKDKEQKDFWGCVSPKEEPLPIQDFLDEFELYNCPIRFITDEIYNWYEEYSSTQDGTTIGKTYAESSSKYLEACTVYKNKLSKLQLIKQKSK